MTIAAAIESFNTTPPPPYQIEMKFKRLNPQKLFSLFINGMNSTNNCNRNTSNIHNTFEINNNDIKNKSNNY